MAQAASQLDPVPANRSSLAAIAHRTRYLLQAARSHRAAVQAASRQDLVPADQSSPAAIAHRTRYQTPEAHIPLEAEHPAASLLDLGLASLSSPAATDLPIPCRSLPARSHLAVELAASPRALELASLFNPVATDQAIQSPVLAYPPVALVPTRRSNHRATARRTVFPIRHQASPQDLEQASQSSQAASAQATQSLVLASHQVALERTRPSSQVATGLLTLCRALLTVSQLDQPPVGLALLPAADQLKSIRLELPTAASRPRTNQASVAMQPVLSPVALASNLATHLSLQAPALALATHSNLQVQESSRATHSNHQVLV